MKSTDMYLLFFLLIAIFGFLIGLSYNRKNGKSWAMSTAISVFIFGLILIVFEIIFIDMFKKPGGIGLEIFVIPIVTLFITAVASGILSAIVHIVEHRSSPDEDVLSTEAHKILKGSKEYIIDTRIITQRNDDWKSFAIKVSQKNN
jgi:ABC-type siderophore export system fused ATPase/permease subunit